MAFCDKCIFYSKSYDEQNIDFNDIGDTNSHFCPMYQDEIPDGVFNGGNDCEYFEEKR